MSWRRRAAAACWAVAALAASACEPADYRPPDQPVGCRTLLEVTGPGGARPAAVQWVVASDSAGSIALDAYCAAVGPAVVYAPAAEPGRAAQDAATVERLVIVAWNMALGDGNLRQLIADLTAGRHTDGVAVPHLVLLLQEAHRYGELVPPAATLPDHAAVSSLDVARGPDIVAIARELGLHLFYVPSMRNGRADQPAADHGNAILSTLPLAEPRALELPHGVRRRVAAVATLDWPGRGPLRAVSVHLDNMSWRRPIASFSAIRERQAHALAAMLNADTVVAGGDLNTWFRGPREMAYRILHARLPRPAEPQPEPTATRLGLPRQLDYLLLSVPAGWQFEDRRIADRYGSDHNPVIGVLQ